MSDYNNYDFTVKEKDIITVLKDAAAFGCVPMLYINGMYYNIELDGVTVPDPRDNDLPF